RAHRTRINTREQSRSRILASTDPPYQGVLLFGPPAAWIVRREASILTIVRMNIIAVRCGRAYKMLADPRRRALWIPWTHRVAPFAPHPGLPAPRRRALQRAKGCCDSRASFFGARRFRDIRARETTPTAIHGYARTCPRHCSPNARATPVTAIIAMPKTSRP